MNTMRNKTESVYNLRLNYYPMHNLFFNSILYLYLQEIFLSFVFISKKLIAFKPKLAFITGIN